MEAQKVRMLDAMFGRESERDPQSPKAKFEKMLEVKLTKVSGGEVLPVTQTLARTFPRARVRSRSARTYPEFQMLPWATSSTNRRAKWSRAAHASSAKAARVRRSNPLPDPLIEEGYCGRIRARRSCYRDRSCLP